MAPPPTLQQDPPYAYVIEHRPLDRCAPPFCRIRGRAVHGYATETMEDGDPGSYVYQGGGPTSELFFQRGLQLRPGETYAFDLPEAAWQSELDTQIASSVGSTDYDAAVIVSELPPAGPSRTITEEHVRGKTAAFATPPRGDEADLERYGKHLRTRLPARERRTLRITFRNDGKTRLSIGSPLVMRRIEGRGPKQAIVAVHDALLFDLARALLHDGTGDKQNEWVRRAVEERGVYFPSGQSCGQGTGDFVVRFFLGDYFAAWGWPGMFGKGFDERPPAVLPGPVARMAEQGFTTVFVGNNFTILPDFGNVGWDVGYQTELKDHTTAMVGIAETWARERAHDDALLVWWSSATHVPHETGRAGPPPPRPPLEKQNINTRSLDGTWRNMLHSVDRLEIAYDALRRAAPRASRVLWIGGDHSSAVSSKMSKRALRTPNNITTGLLHAVGGTSEEMNTPFALIFDDETHAWPRGRRVIDERTSSLVTWKAIEGFFGIDLQIRRTSTFSPPWVFPELAGPRVWDDRVIVSIGTAGTLRAVDGSTAYALFEGKLSQHPIWSLRPAEQYAMMGAPARKRGMIDEELYDDDKDPYEYQNLAGDRFEDTLRYRREVADWMAAHWEDHAHPRNRHRLVFSETTDLELFAPRPFTALVDGAPVPAADPRIAHVHGREAVIVEGSDPVGIVELRGVTTPLVLKCAANGLPLDQLGPDRARFNLALARVNCPLPPRANATAGAGEVLFSFEPARPGEAMTGAPQIAGGVPQRGVQNDDLLAGLKRWGYVRDLDEKK